MTENQLNAINALYADANSYDTSYASETVTSDEEWDELEARENERKAMILAAFPVVWNAEKQKFVWPS
jgi:hypothetical protein